MEEFQNSASKRLRGRAFVPILPKIVEGNATRTMRRVPDKKNPRFWSRNSEPLERFHRKFYKITLSRPPSVRPPSFVEIDRVSEEKKAQTSKRSLQRHKRHCANIVLSNLLWASLSDFNDNRGMSVFVSQFEVRQRVTENFASYCLM